MNQYHWDLVDPVGDSISHHGILGQKWGVRRYQDKSGRLTTEGKKHVKKFLDKSDSDRSARSETIKSAVTGAITGAAGIAGTVAIASTTGLVIPHTALLGVAGTATALSSTAKLIYGDINDMIAASNERKFAEEREANPIDKKTGMHKKTTEMTPDEDMERVNPGYKNWDKNTKNNCLLCTAAFELRRRGYDVQAMKATSGYTDDTFGDWFKGAKSKFVEGGFTNDNIDHMRSSNYILGKNAQTKMINNTIAELKKQKNGARGQIGIIWNGTLSGHSVAYSVENGEPTIYDTQCNEKFVGDKGVREYLEKTSSVRIGRLDNCELNTKNVRDIAA